MTQCEADSDQVLGARVRRVLRLFERFAGRAPLRERRLEVGQVADARPGVLVRRAEQSKPVSAGRCMGLRTGRCGTCTVSQVRRSQTHSSSISESPGNSGARMTSSAKMQPTDHLRGQTS